MHRRVVPALGVCLLIILVLGACGGEDQARKIPETSTLTEARRIPAGSYVSDEFRPAMSFRLGGGWQTGPAADFSYGVFMEKYNSLTLSRFSRSSRPSYLEFLVVPKVYKVVNSYEVEALPAPEDMVSWLQKNPYLDAGKPGAVTVGGAKGKRLDVVASRMPQEYSSGGYHSVNTYDERHCCNSYGEPCLPLFQISPGYGEQSTYELCKYYKVRFTVLHDVDGKTVTISVLAPTAEFGDTWLRAQRVLDTVEWRHR
ncbi:MAG TPA: hypothetical protein VJ827_04605 [Rubrobacter sp.]|nr:hypothetical protein [Rubrobacter sp.]